MSDQGPRRGTTVNLVDDLLRKPPNSLRDELVRNAMAGKYHDFKSTLAMPKVALVEELTRFGFRDLARRAMRGEYDDEQDETDRAEFGKMLAEDPELAALWEQMSTTNDLGTAVGMVRAHLAKGTP